MGVRIDLGLYQWAINEGIFFIFVALSEVLTDSHAQQHAVYR